MWGRLIREFLLIPVPFGTVSVFFFLGQNILEDTPSGRVLLTDVLDDFTVAVDGDALGHQVLQHHLLQRIACHVLRVGVFGQVVRIEVRLAAQLHDALGQLVGVLGFLVGMLEEFIGSHAGLDAAGHEVVTLVAQHADQFGGQ